MIIAFGSVTAGGSMRVLKTFAPLTNIEPRYVSPGHYVLDFDPDSALRIPPVVIVTAHGVTGGDGTAAYAQARQVSEKEAIIVIFNAGGQHANCNFDFLVLSPWP